MPAIKVFHNPNFLDYRDNHDTITPPVRPVATVHAPDGLAAEPALEYAFARTQHLNDPWWNHNNVTLHARSSSVGDVLEDGEGRRFVVEQFGFQPYRPQAVTPAQWLAEAYQLLDKALAIAGDGDTGRLLRQTVVELLPVLETAGCPDGMLSALPWDQSQPGDLVGSPSAGLYLVIARRLNHKWRARRLQESIPTAQLWLDGPRAWAVLLPVASKGVTP
jgi:hypothetical protein